jgi:gluconate 2-dehydrogenase alpha chain
MANGQFDASAYDTNCIDLDPVARDADGYAVVRVTHRIRDNERLGSTYLADKARLWLLEAGASDVWEYQRVEGRHAYGGTRMGSDPETSVVDRHGFSHEVPNLGLIGSSTFPTAGGHNPTLTVQALASWTAQHLVREWSPMTESR